MKLTADLIFLVWVIVFCESHAMALQDAQSDDARAVTGTDEIGQKEKQLPSIAEKVKDFERSPGFLNCYWDQKNGQVFIEVDREPRELLYVHALATGLGSNPIGLDRGQLGGEKVVRFERVGQKVLMIERNLRFRANTANQLEQRSVEQSFAESTIWGGKVVAQDAESYLVDMTSLLLSDAHGVVNKLAEAKQGDFLLDQKRSAVYLPRCKSFPDNTEFEATLTFAGKHVRQTTPTPQSITLRQHHSFIRLPNDSYRPRRFDVRCPSMSITFADYASPLDAPLEQRWILRHRLIKRDPQAEFSEPIEPIIYYVDAGAPAQIQQALLEGASWWDEAFQAAGFKNAFVVKLLPADADPLDVRYNVIQWVHRSTRGWSYGGSVIDPRTGEILKGHVTLGSLRVRQDQLLFNGLSPTGVDGTNAARQCAGCGMIGVSEEATLAGMSDHDSLDVALSRIRQLAAHEVGHTLGFVHNFAASTYGDRASVMDYPAPRINIAEDGKLDLSDAYGVGIGAWDKVAVRYAYAEFPPAEEDDRLDKILSDANDAGMIFISDADSRPAGAAHPLANLWDNGSDPLAELAHVMRVREIAMNNFGQTRFLPRTTTADIAQYFAPIYLHHRFQLKSVGKLIGGQVYQYGYVGSSASDNEIVDPAIQMRAIDALIDTMRPKRLRIVPQVRRMIGARPYSTIRDREMLPSQSGRVFDPLAAARVAADLSLDELLQYERLARLEFQSRSNPELAPSYVIERLVRALWQNPRAVEPIESRQISQVVREALTEQLIELADNPAAAVSVRAAALSGVERIDQLAAEPTQGPESSFRKLLRRRIGLFVERPFEKAPDPKPPAAPPGDPIGN